MGVNVFSKVFDLYDVVMFGTAFFALGYCLGAQSILRSIHRKGK